MKSTQYLASPRDSAKAILTVNPGSVNKYLDKQSLLYRDSQSIHKKFPQPCTQVFTTVRELNQFFLSRELKTKTKHTKVWAETKKHTFYNCPRMSFLFVCFYYISYEKLLKKINQWLCNSVVCYSFCKIQLRGEHHLLIFILCRNISILRGVVAYRMTPPLPIIQGTRAQSML